jgi:peptidoglycan hydrolase CwlO-like protein
MKRLSREKRWDEKLTAWIGSIASLVVHTILFIGVFIAIIFGAPVDKSLLVLTTIVSLEAIYLSILIQMSVNRASQVLEDVEEDIGEIQEDVEEIQEGVEEMEEEIDEIQEDIGNIEEATQKR